MRTVTRKIQIEFADQRIRAVDHLRDIRDGVEKAGLALNLRHNVILDFPMPTEDGEKVMLDIRIPADKAASFSVGNHLRGISDYLLSECTFRYREYLVGRRLLNYIDADEEKVQLEELPASVRLEAVAAFAKLLERSDSKSLSQINKILKILEKSTVKIDQKQ